MELDPEEFRRRRARMAESMAGSVMLLPSAPVALRNNDVEHPYRQDSDLYYLTGFEEPESALVLDARGSTPRAILFVRPRDAERETWDGRRAGTEGAIKRFGFDEAHPIGELDERLPDLVEDAEGLWYRLGRDRELDDRVLSAIQAVRRRARKAVHPPRSIVDPMPVLHTMRLVKEESELERMRRAAEITCQAHRRAMERTWPGRHEYEIEAELTGHFRSQGSARVAYASIVGSGPNATILHYHENDRRMEEGDLLLIDAGCELGYYASDVTRTFPVGGRFTAPQRAVYDVVLAAQKKAVGAVTPGTTMDAIHELTVRELVEGMVAIGLLEGEPGALIESGDYKKYYMHRTSHWLGMDVHDVGGQFVGKEPRRLAPGMVLTIEPGIYVAEDSEAPERFRGVGVRIEDDVLVTSDGRENLTAGLPKEVEDIEALVGSARDQLS